MYKQVKIRDSNFELLRLISIFMVLVLHYFNGSNGGGFDNIQEGTFNYYSMYFIESLCIMAVNNFIIISGYYLINKVQLGTSKIIDLLLLTISYGFVFYLAYAGINYFKHESMFDFIKFAQYVIPIYGAKWFVGSYVVLYLLSPFINKVLNQLNQKQFIQLLIILVSCFSILTTAFPIVTYNDGGYGVLSFILFYSLGAYFKMYPISKYNKWVYLIGYIFSSSITFILQLTLGKITNFWDYNDLFVVISTIFLFLFFYNLKLKSRFINYLSTFVFSIYIIHTNETFSNFFYKGIVHTEKYWDSAWLIGHLIGTIFLQFATCVLIDLSRRSFVKFLYKSKRILKLKEKFNITIG